MKRIAAVTVAAPADLCHRTAEASYRDPRWEAAYASLRPGRSYSARVTASEPGRRLELTVNAIDAVTGEHAPSLGARVAFGYRILYAFAAEGAQRTRVEVAIEYELLAAVGAMGTLQGQAENEILHRVAAMVALESGLQARVQA